MTRLRLLVARVVAFRNQWYDKSYHWTYDHSYPIFERALRRALGRWL